MNSQPSLLQVENLNRTFKTGSSRSLTIFNDLDLTIEAGEIVALVGPSGAGKSTLLQLIGLLDTPTKGRILYTGQDTALLGDYQRTLLRRKSVGFVYQFHHLQPEFSALENVVLPQMVADIPAKQAQVRAKELLEKVGLGERLHHRPATLSGGEQQRVAIVRALANAPKLLLADEPTGNLDPAASEVVFELLMSLVRLSGIGALIATHNMDLARKMDRIVHLQNGKIVL